MLFKGLVANRCCASRVLMVAHRSERPMNLVFLVLKASGSTTDADLQSMDTLPWALAFDHSSVTGAHGEPLLGFMVDQCALADMWAVWAELGVDEVVACPL
eukprot:9522802-Alexandrium_andersonii.AAC.1